MQGSRISDIEKGTEDAKTILRKKCEKNRGFDNAYTVAIKPNDLVSCTCGKLYHKICVVQARDLPDGTYDACCGVSRSLRNVSLQSPEIEFDIEDDVNSIDEKFETPTKNNMDDENNEMPTKNNMNDENNQALKAEPITKAELAMDTLLAIRNIVLSVFEETGEIGSNRY
ncbi:hypothetical protein HCN44_010888 [Aphidius gifuensis]|uniref:Uncharacterized protein n=1 Tax=Aphidius gifuensis TaxID=684658 RepID=A0A834XR61_APHGI|nr:hypothetical protein HCN44_010888 [Aphidius gifuensis]